MKNQVLNHVTPFERISGLLDIGREQFGGLIGVIPGLGQLEALDRGIKAAQAGNYAGASEAAADVIPAGRIATKAIKGLTKGRSTGDVSGVMNIEAPKYQGSHRAPYKDEDGFNAQFSSLDSIYPPDVYGQKALQYYGANQPGERELLALANKVRGNPKAEITMYRAVPKNVEGNEINAGDWVSPSKAYAKYHGDSVLGGDYKILEKKVPAGTLYTNSDSLLEFGYDPTGFGIQGGLLPATTNTGLLNRYEAPQDEALRTAQRNAALPVEQGGLGLRPDNTPMERAKAMGFVIPTYRGTTADEKQLKKSPGMVGEANYSGLSPESGELYAFGKGANMMPLLVRGPLAGNNKQTEIVNQVGWRGLPDELKRRGYSGVADEQYEDAVALTDLSAARSRFAAFDPMRRNEADLLALQGGTTGINLPNFEYLSGLLGGQQ